MKRICVPVLTPATGHNRAQAITKAAASLAVSIMAGSVHVARANVPIAKGVTARSVAATHAAATLQVHYKKVLDFTSDYQLLWEHFGVLKDSLDEPVWVGAHEIVAHANLGDGFLIGEYRLLCGRNPAQASDPDAELGSPVAATTNRGFDAAVNATLNCLSHQDWKAFGKIACPQVVFVLAVRVTPGMISPAQRVYLQHSVTHALDPTENSGMTLESLLEVDSRKPLSLSDKPAFVNFCGAVKSSIDEAKYRGSRIRKGMNLHASDGLLMIGPAVQCPVMSDINWRIEFQRTIDGWRVSRLIVTMH